MITFWLARENWQQPISKRPIQECRDCKLLRCKSVLIGRIWILARWCHMTRGGAASSSIHKGWARCQSMTKDKSEKQQQPLGLYPRHWICKSSLFCRSKRFSSNAKKAIRVNSCMCGTIARIRSTLDCAKWRFFDIKVIPRLIKNPTARGASNFFILEVLITWIFFGQRSVAVPKYYAIPLLRFCRIVGFYQVPVVNCTQHLTRASTRQAGEVVLFCNCFLYEKLSHLCYA